MPVDPKKLQSYMTEAKEANEPADYGDDEASEFVEEGAEELEEAGVEDGYEGFLKVLYENASAIQAAATDVYVTALDEIDEDVKEQIAAALDEMPDELVNGIKQHFAELTPDQLHELIEEMEDMGGIENDASVVAWLYWAART